MPSFQVKFKTELVEELKFVAKCHGSTKPVRRKKTPSDGSDNSEIVSREVGGNYENWFLSDERKTRLT